MKKNQAGFAPVIIVLVVLIGFVGFYYLRDLDPRAVITDPSYSIATVEGSSKPTVPTTKSTPDPTANWKTYNDKLHKLEFSYPSDYSNQGNNNSYYVMSPLLPPTKGYELRDGELKVELYFNPTKEADSLDKYSSEFKLSSESNIISEEKIKISGKEMVHYEFRGPSDADLYLLLHNGFRVQIAKYPIKTSRQPEFDQILSTFKFTN